MTGWLLLIGSIAFNVVGNLLVKQFSAAHPIRGVMDYVAMPFVLGIGSLGLGVLLYGRALQEIPIVQAYPIQVGTCILIIALFAVGVFGEKFNAQHLIGIALVMAGIAVLSRVA
jgi:undecaprenyl phosphate-alpha-L-ara4N flippase subunit ArnE